MRVEILLGGVLTSLLLSVGPAMADPPGPTAPDCPTEDFCCGNRICDPDEYGVCVMDCGSCGNGRCDPYERDNGVCPGDCPPICVPEGCAGRCGTIDDCGTPIECEPCAEECGNGIEDPGETCETCPVDVEVTPTFTASATSVGIGESVTLTASGVMDPPTPLWDMGNADHRQGNPYTYPGYASAGEYAVVLTASEAACGRPKVSQPLFIRVGGGGPPGNRPPVANPGGPYAKQVLEPFLFDGTGSTDPEGTATITTYRWNFGDGTSGTGRVFFPKFYYTTGVHPVTLTVTDNGGLSNSASTTATASVIPPAPPTNDKIHTLEYLSGAGRLVATVSMVVLPPDALTYEPRVQAIVVEPDGTIHDSGLVPTFARDFTAPATGIWTMTAKFYYVRIGQPGAPELIGTVPVSRPVNVTTPAPQILGPREMWWLEGGDGTTSHPTVIRLNATGAADSCEWRVDRGADIVNLQSIFCTAQVRSRGASGSREDVAISVRSGPLGQWSFPHTVTVRTPDHLRFDYLSDSWDGSGYESLLYYTVRDQLNGTVDNGRIFEFLSAPYNDYSPPANWYQFFQGTGPGTFLSAGRFLDRVSMVCYSSPPACQPTPVPYWTAAAGARVEHRDQQWWLDLGLQALRVQRDTLQHHLGYGRHHDVTR